VGSYTCSLGKLAYMFDHSVYTKCEKGWVFEKTKPATIDHHHGSALILWNTCRHILRNGLL